MNQVVIAVGGRGERLKPISDVIPKPLLTFSGETFLFHLIEQFARNGASKFLLLTGYLSDQFDIEAQRIELKLDVTMQTHYSLEECLTGERVLNALPLIEGSFVFLYGDIFLPIRDQEVADLLHAKESQFYAYTGKFRTESQNVLFKDGKLLEYGKSPLIQANGINCGYFLITEDDIQKIRRNLSVEDSLLSLKNGGEFIVRTCQSKYYTTGDPTRRPSTEVFFSRKPTVLFDRDGTLFMGLPPAVYHHEYSATLWKEGAIDLLQEVFAEQMQIAIITNQPAVGNEWQTETEMLEVNQKMVGDLRSAGIAISGVFICSHGWDRGCDCRKPKPGLMYEAQHFLDLNWNSTVYLGDMDRDEEVASLVDCPFIRIESECKSLPQTVFDEIKDHFLKKSSREVRRKQ